MDWTGNRKSIYTPLGASNHSEGEREANDYYATDPNAINALLREVEIPDAVWECACGEGHLSEQLKRHGHFVISTDLINRGYGRGEIDFLTAGRPLMEDTLAIVTNPPYKYATEFVRHGLDIMHDGEYVCMFLKLTFLEGKERRKLFDKSPPLKVLVFSERIKCAKNGDFGSVGASAVAYAWFVWRKGYKGKPTVSWI